jgi:HAD superfamily hydrolase (TIGR01509 family)
MHLVFDMAGVLLQWQPHSLLQRALASLALDDAEARAWVPRFFENFGGDWAEFDRGMVEPPVLAERITRRTGLPLAEVHAVIAGVPEVLQPMSESLALLQRLRDQGRTLHYLSNMPAPYADVLEAAHGHLFMHFEDGLFSGRVRMVKPEPEIFEHAVQRFGLEPATVLFIDDAPSNVAAARAAGWQALQFVDAAQCERELVQRQLL